MSEKPLVLGVTGATGAIGDTLVRHLATKPHIRVLALVRRQPRFAGPTIQTVFGDLFDQGALEKLIAESDVVLHLAARNPQMEPQDRKEQISFFATNSVGAANIAWLAQKHQKPVVFTSSVSVYELSGHTRGVFREEERLPSRLATRQWTEGAEAFFAQITTEWMAGRIRDPAQEISRFLENFPPPENESTYALSKFLGEPWIARMREGIVLRLSDVYGPGHESRGIIPSCLAALLRNEKVTIDFGPRELVSFIYMGDVLRALLAAATAYLLAVPPIINIASPASVPETVLADHLKQISAEGGFSSPISVKRRVTAENSRSFATDKMKHYLGLQEPVSLLEGLRKTLCYLQLSPEQRQR
ncbi:MAG: NAD-dependent epimerase/dehydratase family protein, partial [Anaerolineae bacterium]